MKNLTPRKLAAWLALVISCWVLILLGLIQFYMGQISFFYLIILFLLTFLLCYVIIMWTIDRFIYNKIKVIYKTLHNLKMEPKSSLLNTPYNKDMLDEVNEQVMDWYSHNREEVDRLKKLEVFRREFIGNLAHELKTPIFNIQGYVLTLLEGGLDDATINRDYLLRTENSIERMIALVEDLDMISKLETGVIELKLEKFDIVQLSKDTIKSLELLAKEKNIRIYLKDESEKNCWVLADKERIAQVLTNLLVNTIKYGKENGETCIGFYDLDENVLVEVQDNGIGISKEHLPRIFERFYRADKSRSRTGGGTGLGLSIVKHIMEAHQQSISVDSQADKGTTFTFTLKKG